MQEGAIVRNKRTGAMGRVVNGQVMPMEQQDPVIAVDPYKQSGEVRAQEDQALQRAADERANAAAQRADRADARAERSEQRAATKTAKPTEGESKAAAFLIRALGANDSYEAQGVGARSYIGQKISNTAPDLLNTLPESVGNSPQRQVADTSQDEFIAASLRQDSGAAIPEEEMERQRRIYFPMPGDDEATIKAKSQARLRAIEGLKQSSGVLLDSTLERWETMGRTPQAPEAEGLDESLGLTGAVSDDTPSPYDPGGPLDVNPQGGLAGLVTLGKQGITLGLSDEAAGVGGAISNLILGQSPVAGYKRDKALELDRITDAREATGAAGTVVELLGGGGAGRLASAPKSIMQAMRQGGAFGSVGGFGYGEGAEGSAVNALAGGVLGAGVGAGAQYVGNALTNRAVNRAQTANRAQEVNRAGQAEGVTVNRAMADPQSNNAVTKSDASLIGGRRIQGEMEAIEGQFEGRVKGLGGGGTPMLDNTGSVNRIAVGDKVKGASERFIEKSGKSAKAKYDRAEQLAGSAKVEPKESLSRVDDMIATLNETPSTNTAEIAFLEGIRNDLGKDLSVGALRRMRTNLRKKISRGDLVFGEDEARVLSIMDAAADDIRTGLTAQGNAKAARAFDSADRAYRARMDYITGTVQKLTGKRNANLSSEQIANKFNSLKSSDARGLRRFYATLDPAEQADVAATFAAELGKNNKGDFTVTQFLRQSEGMSDEAINTVFGKQGAESIRNLRKLGKEIERVTGAMNSRTSKSGVANYRDWLFSIFSGGSLGFMQGGMTSAAVAAGAATTVKAGVDVLSARALMSPKLSKWALQAPSTTSPAAINRHFDRLAEIAKAEPAIAGEIETLRKSILGAANDNPGARLAAENQDAEE